MLPRTTLDGVVDRISIYHIKGFFKVDVSISVIAMLSEQVDGVECGCQVVIDGLQS